jgi:glucokinase
MFLGIEIGGTKLQLGLGRGDGQIVGLWRGTVDPTAGGEGIRRQIERAVPELLGNANLHRTALLGVGVGFGGPIDDATRTVIKSHQIAGWDGFPLADWVAGVVGVAAVLGNDADVAGLGEALFGAGKDLSPVFYITIGSGIGGGLIIDGEIFRGCGRGAAEIGHTLVTTLNPQGQAEQGTLESVASGWGIAARARAALEAAPEWSSTLRHISPHTLTARDVAEASQGGDRLATKVFCQAIEAMAQAIRQVIVLLCPQRIVIGGGVSLVGEEHFFGPLRAEVEAAEFAPFRGLTDIVPAALGEEVVVHGALALARRAAQEW